MTTPCAISTFRRDGYCVLPGALAAGQVGHWRSLLDRHITAQPPAPDRTGPYFLWPELANETDLRDLYEDSRIADAIRPFLRAGLGLPTPEVAQLAFTIPPHPHHPGAPHIDGLTPTEDDGRPGTFTVLVGLLLTDQSQRDRGNLWVWPGSHLSTGDWLRVHGADALRNAIPYPPVELPTPRQVTGPAGSLVLVHYLLAHNIGGHFGTTHDERRETVYFRLRADGHRERWRTAVTDPLVEFAQPGPMGGSTTGCGR
ncbi:phytanoyl-CoA dioxygenase family protein [Kitasatospora aureofaciens]|uniref:phytanoyl-CoA dioxygenase family protein n=1 Tax=Kitasatospora aureofaciens TaxID=1894 RepID=UPI001C470BAA|nr:phytanoyl-CoA dioxygenase family protein [Kitasatospora aureofaciens]MBV6695722.1 phytanoyl-CoA dioxygenase family protein [Kitasatospora aureofaciens]